MNRLLISQSIHEHTAESWNAFVRGLRIDQPSKSSKTVPEVMLLFGKRTIVKIARQIKRVTEAEIALLAQEYSKTEQELRELLTSRKVEITNADGAVTNARPAKLKRASKRATKPASSSDESHPEAAAETHAGSKPKRKRRSASQHKLQQPGAPADMPQEGSLQPPEAASD